MSFSRHAQSCRSPPSPSTLQTVLPAFATRLSSVLVVVQKWQFRVRLSHQLCMHMISTYTCTMYVCVCALVCIHFCQFVTVASVACLFIRNQIKFEANFQTRATNWGNHVLYTCASWAENQIITYTPTHLDLTHSHTHSDTHTNYLSNKTQPQRVTRRFSPSGNYVTCSHRLKAPKILLTVVAGSGSVSIPSLSQSMPPFFRLPSPLCHGRAACLLSFDVTQFGWQCCCLLAMR